MKKMIVMLTAAALLLALAVPVLAETPVIKKVEYEGRGYVDVDFRGKVEYSNVSVEVTDANGKAYEATIYELDNDDITFNVANIAEGMDYSFTVSGVRSGFSGEYEAVSDGFRVPAPGETGIKEVDYDDDDRELEVEFTARVRFENPDVIVEDAAGRLYETRIIEQDKNSIEVRVDGLTRGESYTVTVSGVGPADGETTASVSAEFTAR